MALVPLQALGWELGLLEGNSAAGATLPSVSNTQARSGSYSLRFSNTEFSYGRTIPGGLSRLVLGGAFYHNGVTTSSVQAVLFRLLNQHGTQYRVLVNSNLAEVRLVEGTTILESTTGNLIGAAANWLEWSVYFSSGDRFDFYVGSDLILSETVDIDAGDIVAWQVGGRSSSSDIGWSNYLYVDDICLYDATAESTQPAPSRRFEFGLVDGNGQVSQWTGSDGNSTDNYQNVDDGASPDSDSTYNEAASSGLVDQYTCAAVTSPAGWFPVALWPSAIAKKSDAALDIQLALGLWKDSMDDDAAAVDLPVSTYGLAQGRLTALPDGSALNDANINDTEIRVLSAGSYA